MKLDIDNYSNYIWHVNRKKQERLYRTLGENIKKYRVQIGITQEQLAILISLSRTSVVNIEQGRQHPSLHLLFQIADCLSVTLHDLIPSQTEVNDEVVLDSHQLKEVSEKGRLQLTNFIQAHFAKRQSHD